jgi:nucleotide-binding universal stress UspA family protein
MMEQFKRILCPVDFSEYSTRSLRYAIAFAQQHQSKLIVYHCLQPVPSAVYAGAGASHQQWRDATEKQLENFTGAIPADNLEITRTVESGDPATRIAQIAAEDNVDLIVMGTHGAGGYETFLMGSVTNKVLHRVSIPVLSVCRPTRAVLSGDPSDPLLIGKILCPIDPSDVRLPMISRAMFLARLNHASILFFAVYQPGQPRIILDELREVIQPDKETQCLTDFLESSGNPVQEILRAVKQYEIDLVVMGHHRRTPMAMEALGSVTLRIIPGANCPVLVVRD